MPLLTRLGGRPVLVDLVPTDVTDASHWWAGKFTDVLPPTRPNASAPGRHAHPAHRVMVAPPSVGGLTRLLSALTLQAQLSADA